LNQCDLIPQDIYIFFIFIFKKAHFTASFEMRFDDAVKARTKKLSDFKFVRFMSYKTEGRQTIVRLFVIMYFNTICFGLLALINCFFTSTQIQTESPEVTVPHSIANRVGFDCLLLMLDILEAASLFAPEKNGFSCHIFKHKSFQQDILLT
jgi:hypothetical protein